MNPLHTDRAQLLAQLASVDDYDVAVIGGGATGLGVAVDAAARGLKVVLVEAHDFAKGTSSRSTKLIHGGVRYLAQGHLHLVIEALRERKRLLQNAPHLTQAMPFVMPAYRWRDLLLFGLGLKMYALLSGRASLGPTRFLSRQQTLNRFTGVKVTGLVGGVEYWDGQFDDARLALALARTAAAKGAVLVNYFRVTGLIKQHGTGRIGGVICQDAETGLEHRVKARCVVNATGVWVDQIEAMSQKNTEALAERLMEHKAPHAVRPSQGAHLVVDASFWPGPSALLVPHTQDGRVLFAVPWQGSVLLGTTDTPKDAIEWEPQALDAEVDQILQEAAQYLVKPPQRRDVLSVWAGLRPLARPAQAPDKLAQGATQKVSREHAIHVASNGLVSVTGGKWTTYRAMAADVMQAIRRARMLSLTSEDVTVDLPIWGADVAVGQPVDAFSPYGSDAEMLHQMAGAEHWLVPQLSEAMVRFAARYEYARTVEDVLARRNRLLFLDAAAALKVAPQVAAILEMETGVPAQLAHFEKLAVSYLLPLGSL